MKAGGKAFDWSNLRLRVVSTAVLAPSVVGVTWLGDGLFLIMISAAVALLAVEWGLMSAPGAALRVALILSIAVLGALFASYLGDPVVGWLCLPVGAALAYAVTRWRNLEDRPSDAAFGVFYIGIPCLALLWLRQQPSGRDWTLMLLAVTWSADIFAFLVGNLLKGPKLWPRFSPNKTWSGFCGGLVAAGLAGMGVTALARGEADPTVGWALVVGLVAGLATMAGDLWESVLKRRFGVKDSGQLIPGHGGLLDRVDGLMFAALVVAAARLIAQFNAGFGAV